MDEKKILVVDDDPEVGDLIQAALELNGYSVIKAADGLIGGETAIFHKPDLVILDIDMPRKDGLTLCSEIRNNKELMFTPVILLTGARTHPGDRIAGLRLGADEYLMKPFVPADLSMLVNRLILRGKEKLSVSPLTRLPGKQIFEIETKKRLENARQFSVCYFDIDNFKFFNEYNGYIKGDMILKHLALIIISAIRSMGDSNDLAFHLGGDDFIVLTVPQKVKVLCKKIIDNFNKMSPQYCGGQNESENTALTISLAVITNEEAEIQHYTQLIDILSQIKKYARSHPGSVIGGNRTHQYAPKQEIQ